VLSEKEEIRRQSARELDRSDYPPFIPVISLQVGIVIAHGDVSAAAEIGDGRGLEYQLLGAINGRNLFCACARLMNTSPCALAHRVGWGAGAFLPCD